MFPFGVQYYRPPTPPPEEWERDFERMREHGFNIIRGWFTWSWMNPAPGRYDFAQEDRFIKLCRKHGMKAIILVSLESVPPWVLAEHPEAVFIDQDGRRYWPEGFSNTPAGGFPGLCFDNEPVKGKAIEYLRELVRHYKGNPVVACWEPHNEPILEPARRKFSNEDFFCYCDASVRAFRDWLKKRHGTIDALNAAWGRKYTTFEHVTPPRFIGGGTYPDLVDWRLFWSWNVTDMLRWRGRVIKEEDPQAVVKCHTRGYGCIQGNVATWAMDDWQLADVVDIFGGSFFFRYNPDSAYFLNNDDLHAAARGKEWWLSEAQGGPPGAGFHRRSDQDQETEYTPERLEMWTWLPVSQGAKGFLYWQYRSELKGPEWGFGLTDMAGEPTERLERAAKVGRILNENEELFRSLVRPRPRVALGYTPVVNILEFCVTRQTHRYYDSTLGAANVLLHLDHPVDIIRLDEEAVDDDFSVYDAILLPFPLWLSSKSAEKLKTFVERGGLLVADAGLGEYDHGLMWSEVVPGCGLDEVFGVRRRSVRSMEERFSFTLAGKKTWGRHWLEELEPRGAKVVGRSAGRCPVATDHRFGKGRGVYIGAHVFMDYARTDDAGLRSFIAGLLKKIPRPAHTDRPHAAVRVMERPEGGRVYFLFNISPKPLQAKLTVTTKGKLSLFYSSEKSPRKKGPVTNSEGGFKKAPRGQAASFKLGPYGVRILLQEG